MTGSQIADDVTVEHLLAHRSGIGDYSTRKIESISDYLMPVPVQDLATTDDYVRILDAPTVFFLPANVSPTTTPAVSCSQHSPRQRPARPFTTRG